MDTWASYLLLGGICLIGVDILVMIGFIVYMFTRWYRRNRNVPVRLKTESETINYDDAVAITTKPVPVVFDEVGERPVADFEIPKKRLIPKYEAKQNEAKSMKDFDVPMYFSEPSLVEEPEHVGTVAVIQSPMLAFSFYYNAGLHELTVVLIRGKRINVEEELDNSSHILISVVLIPEGSIQHSSRGIPPNPLFKERFTFFLNGDELKISKVKFNVWKVDKYSRKLPFGEIIVNMADVFRDDVIKTSCVEDIWKEIEPKEKLIHETPKGELLTSLQYLPGAERVNINIMKGRDLKLEEFDKDVYVKVSAVINGKVFKNKKTSVMRKTMNPLFNETTSFQLAPHTQLKLDEMSIIVSVYAYRSRGPHKRLIGRCMLGSTDLATTPGKEYWEKMMRSPRKTIAEWQEIQ